MVYLNKFGLPREIPPDIKLIIRRNSGFGCVICGNGITDYEHVDPVYIEAKEHDPYKMTLLCIQCHGKVSRRMMSKDKVKEAMKNPCCKKKGYSNESFDFNSDPPTIIIGGASFKNCKDLIRIGTFPLISIKSPEEPGAPFRLSGTFFNSNGYPSLKIINNEWRAMERNWDVSVEGATITVREGNYNVALKITSFPPTKLVIERIKMKLGANTIIGGKDYLKFNDFTLKAVSMENFGVGIQL